jgi:hypothetical protein
MAHGGIDIHKNQSPNVETVAKVVGHVYPVWSKYVHLTFHRRFQRHPHTDQWFEESAVFPVHFTTAVGERTRGDFPVHCRALSGILLSPTNWLDFLKQNPTSFSN